MAVLSGHASVLPLAVLLSLQAAGPEVPTDHEVKAAFLCSFPEYVEWPEATPRGPIRIGVLGIDPFGTLLEQTVRARPLQTKALEIVRLSAAREGLACHLVFICASEERALPGHLRVLDGASVLTVSDIPRFVERGGMIGFVLEERRVRFQVDPDAAGRVGIRISSHLLGLARIVRTRRSDG